MENKNTIGENIARKRRQKGLTQEELAEKMNVSAQAVSKWENDQSYPDIETLGRLAGLFECTLDALVNGEPAAPVVKSAEPDKVDRRTLTITAEENGEKVKIRFPVSLVKRAAESGKLKELFGDKAEPIGSILSMINEGAVGELLNVEEKGACARIAVEDYES